MMKILLASDADRGSDGAIRMALELSESLGAWVEVIRVIEPLPVIGEGGALAGYPLSERSRSERGNTARAELETTLRAFGPAALRWPRQVVVGSPAHSIVEAAERLDAALILIGSGTHEPIDRWLGTETALRVMQLSHIPVLAVPTSQPVRPRKLVAAVDFSSFSRDALETALRVCRPDSEVHLVHVTWLSPAENAAFEGAEWQESLHEQLERDLETWVSTIPGLSAYETHLHVRAGRPATEILAVAAEIGADLIVAGSHGRSFMGRLIFGSTSKGLLRKAECAILIAPPREPTPERQAQAHDDAMSNS